MQPLIFKKIPEILPPKFQRGLAEFYLIAQLIDGKLSLIQTEMNETAFYPPSQIIIIIIKTVNVQLSMTKST